MLGDGVDRVDIGLIVRDQAKEPEFYLKCKREP